MRGPLSLVGSLLEAAIAEMPEQLSDRANYWRDWPARSIERARLPAAARVTQSTTCSSFGALAWKLLTVRTGSPVGVAPDRSDQPE